MEQEGYQESKEAKAAEAQEAALNELKELKEVSISAVATCMNTLPERCICDKQACPQEMQKRLVLLLGLDAEIALLQSTRGVRHPEVQVNQYLEDKLRDALGRQGVKFELYENQHEELVEALAKIQGQHASLQQAGARESKAIARAEQVELSARKEKESHAQVCITCVI